MSTIDSEARQQAARIQLMQYSGMPCRICGKIVTDDELKGVVWAGASADNKTGIAHPGCWQESGAELLQSTWVHP